MTHSRQGFTLIETLIYVALFVTVMTLVMLAVFQMFRSADSHRARLAVDAEADFLMHRILWALSGASVVNAPAASSTGSRLSVDRYLYAQNPVVIEKVDTHADFSKGSGVTSTINSRKVRIDALEFTHLPATAIRPPGVSILLSASAVTIEALGERASTTITTTIYLRQ